MPAPDQVNIEKEETRNDEYIIGHVKGERVFFSRVDAISLINELSGVLLADEYRSGYKQRQGEHNEEFRRKEG